MHASCIRATYQPENTDGLQKPLRKYDFLPCIERGWARLHTSLSSYGCSPLITRTPKIPVVIACESFLSMQGPCSKGCWGGGGYTKVEYNTDCGISHVRRLIEACMTRFLSAPVSQRAIMPSPIIHSLMANTTLTSCKHSNPIRGASFEVRRTYSQEPLVVAGAVCFSLILLCYTSCVGYGERYKVPSLKFCNVSVLMTCLLSASPKFLKFEASGK